MMFDFGGDEVGAAAAGAAAGPPDGQPAAGDGDKTKSPNRAAPPSVPSAASGPAGKTRQEASEEYERSETEPVPGQDAVTALLPVIKDISRQFSAYTAAMETAVRDLAESENDLQAELQRLVQRSKQVLATHGQMRHHFTDRLGKVSRCLRSQQSPTTSQEDRHAGGQQ